MIDIVIHSRETLVFRDGRPFGDSGHVNGGLLNWPMPATVSGVVRSRIGVDRDKDFFFAGPGEKEKNIESIRQVSIARVIPLWKGKNSSGTDRQQWDYLFPAPADAILFDTENSDDKIEKKYDICAFKYETVGENEGVGMPENWLLPISSRSEKPGKDTPCLWFKDVFFKWLENSSIDTQPVAGRQIGVNWPQIDQRMHTAIDPDTGTVRHGQLFSSHGIRLESSGNHNQQAGAYGIGVTVDNVSPEDDPTGGCRFGGERKVALIDKLRNPFPACPDWFAKQKFLRLVLISPGNFGGWAPGWLKPELTEELNKQSQTSWVSFPGSDIKLRLVSAFVGRWQPVSGWNLETGKPKATIKLVPPGSVFVVELQDVERSQEFAKLVWGRSIDGQRDPMPGSDGYSCVCVGRFKPNI